MTNSEKIVSLMKSLEILKGKKIQLEKEVSLNQEMLLSNAGKSEAKAYAEALMVAETEYKATLQAIARNEELLNAQVKLENSQEFKNKVAEVHKTKADCLKRTSEVVVCQPGGGVACGTRNHQHCLYGRVGLFLRVFRRRQPQFRRLVKADHIRAGDNLGGSGCCLLPEGIRIEVFGGFGCLFERRFQLAGGRIIF